MFQIGLPLSSAAAPAVSFASIVQIGPLLLAAGWILLVFLLMWIIWNTYVLIKRIDYFSSIEWTFLEILIPPDSEETPKSMELFYEVIGGMHKSPDLVEKYFDGYMEAWISCEIQCTAGQARYFIITPSGHRQLVEAAVYAQYPRAEVRETEDYTRRFTWQDLRKKIDIFGAEIVLVDEDHFPIRTYIDYETKLAEEDKFIDPHQVIIETFTNVFPGEEFWLQVLIRPVDAGAISDWTKKGQKQVMKISGQAKEEKPGVFGELKTWLIGLPGEVFNAFFSGPLEVESKDDKPTLRFFNPVDEAKMKGILQKISRTGFATKIRVIYLAPAGQVLKPNIGRAIGVFKQFNTFHMNSLKPDSATKTNGANYIARDRRRYLRERKMFLQFAAREIWYGDGKMFTAEELATLYHFPSKHVKTPGLARAKSGLQSPPSNLPYAG